MSTLVVSLSRREFHGKQAFVEITLTQPITGNTHGFEVAILHSFVFHKLFGLQKTET